jgi:hypothetical protein
MAIARIARRRIGSSLFATAWDANNDAWRCGSRLDDWRVVAHVTGPRVMHEVSAREGNREAFTGETTGWVSSCETGRIPRCRSSSLPPHCERTNRCAASRRRLSSAAQRIGQLYDALPPHCERTNRCAASRRRLSSAAARSGLEMERARYSRAICKSAKSLPSLGRPQNSSSAAGPARHSVVILSSAALQYLANDVTFL